MRKRLYAVLLGMALAGVVVAPRAEGARAASGGRSSSGRKKAKVKVRKVDVESLTHGPDICAEAEAKLAHDKDGNIVYQENVPADPDVKRPWVSDVRQAPVSQTSRAPDLGEAGPEGTLYPIIVEEVVDSFLEGFRRALPIVEVEEGEEITAEGLERLKDISDVLLRSSRDLVKAYDALARERRLKEEGWLKVDPELHRGKVEDSILAATDEWLEVVERIETSALRFRRGALMRSPERLQKAWAALVDAGLEVPQFRSSMQAILVKRERRRAKE